MSSINIKKRKKIRVSAKTYSYIYSIIKKHKNMGKLKQYEIDAIVSTICNQIDEASMTNNQTKYGKANKEIGELEAEIKETNAKLQELYKAKDKKVSELSKKLGKDVWWNSGTHSFTTTRSTSFLYSQIKNELIIFQIDDSNDIQSFIKEIVKKYSK
jgi:hypothetical protein